MRTHAAAYLPARNAMHSSEILWVTSVYRVLSGYHANMKAFPREPEGLARGTQGISRFPVGPRGALFGSPTIRVGTRENPREHRGLPRGIEGISWYPVGPHFDPPVLPVGSHGNARKIM